MQANLATLIVRKVLKNAFFFLGYVTKEWCSSCAYDALFGFNPRLDNCSQNKNSTSLITTKEVVINVLQHGEQLAHILGKANGTCVSMCLYVFVCVCICLYMSICLS